MEKRHEEPNCQDCREGTGHGGHTKALTLKGIPIHVCDKAPKDNKLWSSVGGACPFCGWRRVFRGAEGGKD